MIPARAPIRVKQAPRLLPKMRANMAPVLAVPVTSNDLESKTLVSKIVIGWLLIMFASKIESPPIRKTEEKAPVALLAIPLASQSIQPLDVRPSTRINIPKAKGITFQGMSLKADQIVRVSGPVEKVCEREKGRREGGRKG